MEFGMRMKRYSRAGLNQPASQFILSLSPSREKFRFKKHYFRQSRVKDTSDCVLEDQKSQPEGFLAVGDELRQRKQLFDGIIKSSDGSLFHVHRFLLATFSPFFRAFFTNTLNHGQTELHELHLKDIPSEVIALILDFAYTGQCAVNKENVEKLLSAADQLECVSIVKACSEFLIAELCTENCLGILRFAKYYSCKALENEAKNFIRWNCVDIFRSNSEFEELSWEDVYDILIDDYLNVAREEIVYEAVDRWINRNPDEREKFHQILFQCIRFGLMDKKYLQEIIQVNKHLNKDTRQFLRTIEIESEYGINCSKTFMRPRIPYEILFAVGGWSKGSPTTVIETYDPRAGRWFIIDYEDMTPRAYHGLASFNNMIYMFGGFDGEVYFNTVRCFDPVERKWTEKACMSHTRCYASIAILDGEIYVMGGYNGRDRMPYVEKYNPEENTWKSVQSMNCPRSDASAATLQDKIYIVGGFNGIDVLMSAEVYNPTTGQWTYISAMSTPRSGVSLLAYKDCLYAIGGYDGSSRLNSVEKYNPLGTEIWHSSQEMLLARSNFGCIVHEDRIFVIGGFDGTSTMCDTEFFDEERDEWVLGTPMNINRSALSACVCRGLPNSYDYSLAGITSPSPLINRSSST